MAVELQIDTPRSQGKPVGTISKALNESESQSRPEIKPGGSLLSPRPGSSGAPAYAKLPSVSLGTGVRAPGFLNQGDSEDSDA